jgi:hypothetical protein
MYGHTHSENAIELQFNSGKTLFFNGGENECTSRTCSYMLSTSQTVLRHNSILAHLKNGSAEISLDFGGYNKYISNSTPTFQNLDKFNLRKEFIV